jgi:hypothetical protein
MLAVILLFADVADMGFEVFCQSYNKGLLLYTSMK